MIRIRTATREDIPTLVSMGLRFINGTRYMLMLNASTPAGLTAFGERVFDLGDDGVMLIAETDTALQITHLGLEPVPVGMLIAVALPNVFSGERWAEELCWWVDLPARRTRAGPMLLAAAEVWALERECVGLKMVAPEGSGLRSFYERMGYEAVETTFKRALPSE